MIDQSNLFRARCFGSFLDLFRAVTIDPAMLQWLNGNENYKWAPNENYGREMMELFSLGADRGAYSEDDIREQARALTGWRNDWSGEEGAYNFRFEPKWHDTGTKTVFGHDRQLGLGRRLPALRRAPPPPLLLRRQAVELLRPHAALDAVREGLDATYVCSGWQIRPVLEAILHAAPSSTKARRW